MDNEVARRAITAAQELLASLELDDEEAVVLHDSNRLTVLLLPCDLVARIGPISPGGAELEIDRALRLAAVGAPVGTLDPRTPPRVHVRDGFEITLWAHHAQRSDRELSPACYADALARLHMAMREADLDVPPLSERVGSALSLVDDPGRTPRLTGPDRAFLHETLIGLGAEIERRGTHQVLHGEPHPGNILDTAEGPLFIDLETCCTGPVEFDLAHAPTDVAAHYPGLDTDLLADCRILSWALATSWRWDRDDSLPSGERLGAEWLQHVREMMSRRSHAL
ncbi:MAG: phosphotransferase [Brachybacterium sp.]|uniref:phosphotransferase n=1 Tax=Brachybacterium sp. TaxID=1891286 RepID=UPI002647FF0F|nr:phosphotransferase [Brachybacterium sp.]MDN5688669.1 phosphotransferase [Brachybacterium sp.]